VRSIFLASSIVYLFPDFVILIVDNNYFRFWNILILIRTIYFLLYRRGWCRGAVLGLYSEVLDSNLGRGTSYPDWDFSFSWGKFQNRTSFMLRPLPSKSLPDHSLAILPSDANILVFENVITYPTRNKNARRQVIPSTLLFRFYFGK
jgi:hypothetical protein